MPVRNHAMECRINAETPNFLPSCGTVTALRVPGGPRVRWDSAMFTGAKVPPYYDSMLGKLIVCAPTRDGAIRKMRSALGELVIEGVSENSELQLDVLANDEFLSGMYHTDLMGHLYAGEYKSEDGQRPRGADDRVVRRVSRAPRVYQVSGVPPCDR